MPLMNPMSGFPGMPSMNGTWYNQKTGDAFVVRDQFFSDNGPVVMTQDGRQIEGAVLSDYLQISEHAMTPEQIAEYKKDFEEDDILFRPFNSPMTTDPTDLLNTPMPYQTQTAAPAPAPAPKHSTNYDIIDKAFGDKVESPSISLSWPNPPTKQIDLLHDIMDIPYKDIAEYIYLKYIKDDDKMIEEVEKLIPDWTE